MIFPDGFQSTPVPAEGGPPFLYRPPTEDESVEQWMKYRGKIFQDSVNRFFWGDWNQYHRIRK